MRRGVRFLGAVVVVAALCPASASASHPTQICLDLDPDRHHAVSNDDIIDTVWAYPGATDAGHPPQYQGCVTERNGPDQDWTDTQIDFEITGVGDNDGDTPETPDLTCTVGAGGGGCSVPPPRSAGGEQTIRGWIDLDKDDGTMEGVDLSEGYDEGAEPGTYPEPDMTDAALWTWTHGDPPPEPCGNDGVCSRRITIDYRERNGTFFGEVKGEDGDCQTSTVTVKRVRKGRDRTIVQTGTSDQVWRARTHDSNRGRFYAVLGKSFAPIPNTEPPAAYECSRDRSRTIELG